MGHTINPTEYRVGFSKNWIDSWHTPSSIYNQILFNTWSIRSFLHCYLSASVIEDAGLLYSHFNINLFKNKYNINIYLYDGLMEEYYQQVILQTKNLMQKSLKKLFYNRNEKIYLFKNYGFLKFNINKKKDVFITTRFFFSIIFHSSKFRLNTFLKIFENSNNSLKLNLKESNSFSDFNQDNSKNKISFSFFASTWLKYINFFSKSNNYYIVIVFFNFLIKELRLIFLNKFQHFNFENKFFFTSIIKKKLLSKLKNFNLKTLNNSSIIQKLYLNSKQKNKKPNFLLLNHKKNFYWYFFPKLILNFEFKKNFNLLLSTKKNPFLLYTNNNKKLIKKNFCLNFFKSIFFNFYLLKLLILVNFFTIENLNFNYFILKNLNLNRFYYFLNNLFFTLNKKKKKTFKHFFNF